MRKYFALILFAVLSLTAFAEKKTITVQQPKCDDAIVANILKASLTEALANSEEWQPVAAGGQCLLITEVSPMGKSGFISCKIMDTESARLFASATEQSQLKPKKIQKACKSLAKQLLGK